MNPQDYVDEIKGRVFAVLPRAIDPKRYMSIMLEYLHRNSALLNCDRATLDEAIVDAALMGLYLGRPFELAEVLPFKDNDRGRPARARLIIEYRGLMAQAYLTGAVESITARPVYAGDKFDYQFGDRPLLVHKRTKGEYGALIFAYAIAYFASGGTAIEVITEFEANRARADSPGANRPGSAWNKRPAEMWTKTAIKKLSKSLPRSIGDISINSGPGPPDLYTELLNAVSVSPDLYRRALANLNIDSPTDPHTTAIVLDEMRNLYRSKK